MDSFQYLLKDIIGHASSACAGVYSYLYSPCAWATCRASLSASSITHTCETKSTLAFYLGLAILYWNFKIFFVAFLGSNVMGRICVIGSKDVQKFELKFRGSLDNTHGYGRLGVHERKWRTRVHILLSLSPDGLFFYGEKLNLRKTRKIFFYEFFLDELRNYPEWSYYF